MIPAMRFAGRVVVVTGSSRNIGLTTARRFAPARHRGDQPLRAALDALRRHDRHRVARGGRGEPALDPSTSARRPCRIWSRPGTPRSSPSAERRSPCCPLLGPTHSPRWPDVRRCCRRSHSSSRPRACASTSLLPASSTPCARIPSGIPARHPKASSGAPGMLKQIPLGRPRHDRRTGFGHLVPGLGRGVLHRRCHDPRRRRVGRVAGVGPHCQSTTSSTNPAFRVMIRSQ